jgi:hypothetical protein
MLIAAKIYAGSDILFNLSVLVNINKNKVFIEYEIIIPIKY